MIFRLWENHEIIPIWIFGVKGRFLTGTNLWPGKGSQNVQLTIYGGTENAFCCPLECPSCIQEELTDCTTRPPGLILPPILILISAVRSSILPRLPSLTKLTIIMMMRVAVLSLRLRLVSLTIVVRRVIRLVDTRVRKPLHPIKDEKKGSY